MPIRKSRRVPVRPWRRLRRYVVWFLLSCVVASLALVVLLRWLHPPYSAVMLQRLISEGAPQHQRWVALEQIDPDLALAVVAAEDQRFPAHWGFDTAEILAAVERHLEGGRLRGASTISQQTARNLFLWQGRSFLRKGLEVWYTALIEAFWPKRRILEMYLNFAEMGDRTFGVAAATGRYYGADAANLSRGQAALLAAVLPNPRVYRVDAPSDYLIGRREWILQQMRALGGVAYLDGILPKQR